MVIPWLERPDLSSRYRRSKLLFGTCCTSAWPSVKRNFLIKAFCNPSKIGWSNTGSARAVWASSVSGPPCLNASAVSTVLDEPASPLELFLCATAGRVRVALCSKGSTVLRRKAASTSYPKSLLRRWSLWAGLKASSRRGPTLNHGSGASLALVRVHFLLSSLSMFRPVGSGSYAFSED